MRNETTARAIPALLLLSTVGAFGQVAYVGNGSEFSISTVNESNGALAKVARAGLYGASLSVSANGLLAAVQTIDYNDTAKPPGVNLVDLTTGVITTPFSAISNPTFPLISPDGSFVIMRSYNQAFSGLVEASTTTGTVLASLSLDGTIPLLITPDSSGIYAPVGAGLSLLDSKTLATKANVPGVYPIALALSSDGTRLYAATTFSRATPTILSIIDTASNTVIATVPATNPQLGKILGLTLSPDNKTAYLATQYALLEVSTVSASVSGYIKAPGALSGSIAASADGNSVFACRFQPNNGDPGLSLFNLVQGTASVAVDGGDSVALVRPAPSQPIFLLNVPSETLLEDPANAAITTTIHSTLGVNALAVSASGNRVAGVSQFAKVVGDYATGSVEVSVIDTASHEQIGEFAFPSSPIQNSFPAISIALSSDGSLGYMIEPILVNNVTSLQISTLQLPAGIVQSSFTLAETAYTVAIAPDDSRLYLNGTCAVTLATQALQCTAPFNGNPQATAVSSPALVSADGTSVYTAAAVLVNGQTILAIDEIDSATMTLRREVGLPQSRIGGALDCVVPSIGLNSLYVACSKGILGILAGVIVRIDLSDFTLAATQFPNYVPEGIAATPDGTQVLVTGSNYGTQVFDGTTLAYTNSISGGIQSGIVMAPQ